MKSNCCRCLRGPCRSVVQSESSSLRWLRSRSHESCGVASQAVLTSLQSAEVADWRKFVPFLWSARNDSLAAVVFWPSTFSASCAGSFCICQRPVSVSGIVTHERLDPRHALHARFSTCQILYMPDPTCLFRVASPAACVGSV